MKRNKIRLNESQLKNIIKYSLKKTMNESEENFSEFDLEPDEEERQRQINSDWDDIDNASKGKFKNYPDGSIDTWFTYDDKKNMYHSFGNKSNFDQVYPCMKGYYGMKAQNPSSEGNYARMSDVWGSKPIGTDNTKGYSNTSKSYFNISESKLNNIISQSIKRILRENTVNEIKYHGESLHGRYSRGLETDDDWETMSELRNKRFRDACDKTEHPIDWEKHPELLKLYMKGQNSLRHLCHSRIVRINPKTGRSRGQEKADRIFKNMQDEKK